jgi:uncharacterized membrane protein YgdD (TMEM256/DUF423 family)
MKQKNILAIASFSMVIAVVIGAMGAHALKPLLTNEYLTSLETGVKYQVYHSLAILVLSFIIDKYHIVKPIKLMMLGVILFSGSIYGLTINELFQLNIKMAFVFFTPLGGSLLIVSWFWLALKFLKTK